MRRKSITRLTAIFAGVAAAGAASEAQAVDARLRVVDVGNAMCVVLSVPGGHHMLYDAGNYDTTQCAAAVREIVGNDRLDLVVLSHSDADHIGELPAILRATRNNPPVQIVYTGHPGTSRTTWPAVRSLLQAMQRPGQPTPIRNLQTHPLPNIEDPPRGRQRAAPLRVQLGAATVTFVAGWPRWPYPGDRGATPNASERRNAISIVVRIDYGEHSVLLTGDTIGRRGRSSEPVSACRDSERWMVQEGNVPLDADILIGQHHGGDNSSSTCFIEAVSPRWVIFPAGHAEHGHPRQSTVSRFLNLRPRPIMLRTDRSDDEPGDEEWADGLVRGCVDPAGDDDVEIVLSDRPRTRPRVEYRHPVRPCPPPPPRRRSR